MLILAIDTSGETCSVAVSDGSVCRAEYRFRHERRLIERVPGIVQSVLTDTGLTLSDIEAFAVGLGPGSFTGVRVGVTFAKVWAMTLDKPVVGVSSLDALAWAYHGTGQMCVAVAPTRKTESIAGFYQTFGRKTEPIILPNTSIVTHAMDVMFQKLNGVPLKGGEMLVLGEIVDAIGELDESHQPGYHIRFVRSFPQARDVADLAYRSRLSRGESDDTDSLVPLYVTPPPTG